MIVRVCSGALSKESFVSDKQYDLIVIGGGISGLGVAWKAAARGLKVVLLEKGELCRATSDNSLRIIHGGLRYLQQMNIKRVLDSAKEQSDLLRIAPDLIKPLWCVMPLSKFGLKSKVPMWCGLQLYRVLRLLVGAGYGKCGKIVSAAWVDEKLPLIKGEAPHGAFVWRDAIMPSDRKFAKFVESEVRKCGAEIFEKTEVTAIKKIVGGYEVVTTSEGGALRGKCVVNATGAWLQRFPQDSLFKPLKWCKAFNIVIAKKVIEEYALGVSGELGRVFFLAPREDNEFDKAGTAVGTFYYMCDGDPAEVAVSAEELEESLRRINKTFPNLKVTKEDIIEIELGILPAYGEDEKGPKLYGSEKLRIRDGYIEVLSTKYTTFRSQARHVMKGVTRFL